jgi:hypothetical protein
VLDFIGSSGRTRTYNPSVNRGIVKPGKLMISKESITGVADPQGMKRSLFL